ncbi:hypothetical protein CAEBREN_24706 [Caenorhabditis brenneri]|uniref:T20D4.11-like domain-containing protein n=1 Tax=Caenorhabditis brenneri TaxID=135651 RepID=G0NEX7_CAEBE|nr:hypothetical protein CAEBREN_24706 [Caenorhabditis brenneri]
MKFFITFSLLFFLFPLIFTESSPFGCSTEDLQLTTTCRPKLTKLTDEMKKNPLNSGFPSVETLQKMSGYCKEAMDCVKTAKCDAIKEKMNKFSKTCQTIDFMKGPYAQCAAKLKASKDKTECIQWYFSDKSRMSTEQKCAQFKAKKSCIEKDFGKSCGDSTLKSFRENLDYVSKFVGCPVH